MMNLGSVTGLSAKSDGDNGNDGGASLVRILLDLGPACTSGAGTLREALRLAARKSPPSASNGGGGNNNGGILQWKEAAAARLIHFFGAMGTEPSSSGAGGKEGVLSAAFVGAWIDDPDWSKGDGQNQNQRGEWNLEAVSRVLADDFAPRLNWALVARSLDFPEFRVRDGRHLEAMLALYRAGSGGTGTGTQQQLPLDAATAEWSNRAGQLSLLEHLLACPPAVYAFPADAEEALDAATVVADGTMVATNCPNPGGWASSGVLQRLLHLSDDKSLHPRVREIFVVGLLSCPEIILCALVRLQLSVARSADQAGTGADRSAAASDAGAGMPMKGELMRELIPLFFKPRPPGGRGDVVRNMPGALRRLWGISQNTVVAACIEAWRSTAGEVPQERFRTVVHIIGAVRMLSSPENAIATILNGNKDPEFSFTVAFVMADHDMLQLRPWLQDRWGSAGANKGMFAVALVSYVGKNYPHAQPRRSKPLVSVENLGTTLQFVVGLDAETMGNVVPTPSGKALTLGESVRAVTDACLSRHPQLAEVLPGHQGGGGLGGGGGGLQQQQQQHHQQGRHNHAPGSQDDIEECANQYFQQIYASEESARRVVEMLKSFKASGTTRENDIFACMIHNLFDEYRFFSKYPEKELRITGILFGLLIKEQLVSSITLGIALRYVLEALRKSPAQSPQSGKMFRFGMFALEQFKERLHEWPQYCSHIVQIPHLREGYASLVGEIEGVVEEGQGQQHAAISSGASSGMSSGPGVPAGAMGGGNASDAASSSGDASVGGGATVLSAGSVPLGGEISVPLKNPNQINVPVGGFVGSGAGVAGGGPSAFLVPRGNGGGGLAVGGQQPSRIELPAPTVPVKESKPRKAVFGPGLGRAVNAQSSSSSAANASSGESGGGEGGSGSSSKDSSNNEAPPDAILDRVQFLINNLSMSNVETKSRDLRDMLERRHFGWLGNYLVVKRISTQPNFHGLYLTFLDNLGEYGRGLVEAILSSVYVNVGKLLRSQKITTSTSERSLLKNLGSWLGQITLARNRPILQIMLDCKELLFQGYETGMLIAVTPFVAKILEGAKGSVVFRPPNPWLMGLLGVFRALYDVDDLKMNIKFEVEVLCKNLGLRLEDIPANRRADLARRVSPVKERNPDFNLKSQNAAPSSAAGSAGTPSKAPAPAALSSPDGGRGQQPGSSTASTGGDSAKSSDGGGGDDPQQQGQQTVIPNLAAYVNVNPNLTQLFHAVQGGPLATHVTSDLLRRSVPVAVDRAIREIIQPVVERSVSIACITTKAIVTKDFAMEGDEGRMRKAAQLMVANLAGSLALVTCREPLHASISSHLRNLLLSAVNGAGGGTNSAGGQQQQVQLRDQETSALDQCVAICSTENLELGCMLIEKAATEKAVRDADESLAPALQLRRTHREREGTPYYDASIFRVEGQRYPKELPDPLRPKPGGLRPEQLLVYDAFRRIPRQPPATAGLAAGAGSADQTSAGSDGPGADGRPAGDAPASSSGAPPMAGGGLNMNAINAIALKLDSSVTTLLNTAGPRAGEISLAMIPPEHEIKQLIAAVPRVVGGSGGAPLSGGDDASSRGAALLTPPETDSILSFSQGIFKRLYEVSISERLRLEALVSLLGTLDQVCPQLGRDMGTWATYAPTKTDAQRRLHRAVLLLLVRGDLIRIVDLDAYLAKNAEGGRNGVWLEFLMLFVRTAFLENIAPPSKMPKMMEVVRGVAEEGGQSGSEINPTFRKAAARLMEELRGGPDPSGDSAAGDGSQAAGGGDIDKSGKEGQVAPGTTGRPVPPGRTLTYEESSSMSPASLHALAGASIVIARSSRDFASADPPNARQLVTEILVHWLRVQGDSSANDKTAAQFLQRLQAQFGVGTNDDRTERFLRLATEAVVESCAANGAANGGVDSTDSKSGGLGYQAVDGYARLLSCLVRYPAATGGAGQSAGEVSGQRLNLLNKVLGVIARSMVAAHETAHRNCGKDVGEGNNATQQAQWDQRPWFRLLLDLVCELNLPNPALDPIKEGIVGVFGSAFHVVQPLVVPGFAFAWLELISHRMFLSNLLLAKERRGWGTMHRLLIDLLLFLEPHLRRVELTDAIKRYYDGALRVVLVLAHDFPAFLAAYHLSFCNIIPEGCVQLRNLVLSAAPEGVTLHDPVSRSFKIDRLPEITRDPTVLSEVAASLAPFRADLDGYLREGHPTDFLAGLGSRLRREGGKGGADAPRVNSLVLYVGMRGIARLRGEGDGRPAAAAGLGGSPEMEMFQALMNVDYGDGDTYFGRYISLNAIANQLRYPSSHTHYFSCVMLCLFNDSADDGVKEQITRVLLERLITQRPHPWGLLITFIELIKNSKYRFWTHPFTRCAAEIERVFENVARSCMLPQQGQGGHGPAAMRTVTAGGAGDSDGQQ